MERNMHACHIYNLDWMNSFWCMIFVFTLKSVLVPNFNSSYRNYEKKI